MKRILPLLGLTLLLYLNISVAKEGNDNSPKSQSTTGTAKKHTFSGVLYMEGYKMPEKSSPVEMAYQFFELNKDHYRMINPREELVLKRQVQDEYGAMVSFEQTFNGIPLLHSDIRAHFDGRGVLKEVDGDYLYDIDLPTTPQFDSASAIQLTLKDIGTIPENRVARPSCPGKPVIAHSAEFEFHNEDRLYLVWPVTVIMVTATSAKQDTIRYQDGTFDVTPLISYGSYGYYIDALTGTILKKGWHRSWE